MWISRKTDYATRAVLALAIADGERLNAQDLSRRVAVPEPFMKQILMQLRDAGVVRSERGPAGGYRLNHDPSEITLERIVRIFQGQLAPIECATRHEPQPCPMEVECSLRSVWAEVRDATIAILERTNFDELAAQAGGPWKPVALTSRP
jgi:Rrf2 family protein